MGCICSFGMPEGAVARLCGFNAKKALFNLGMMVALGCNSIADQGKIMTVPFYAW